MFRFLQAIVSRLKSSPRARQLDRLKRRRMNLEQLDDRRMLAGVPSPSPGIYLSEGNLKLIGDSTQNDAHVWVEGDKVKATLEFTTYHEVGEGSVVPITTVKTAEYDATLVSKIYSYGYAGNDSFLNDTSIPSVAFGSSGNDWLRGGSGADMLYGSGDNDELEGRGGDDWLDGGAGSDQYTFNGFWLGSDTVKEADGLDSDDLDFMGTASPLKLNLASTSKQLVQSVHLLNGLSSPSLYLTLTSATGIEDVFGTKASDTIYGNSRNNLLYGNDGHDKLYGYAGNDAIYGHGGNDQLYGGFGQNTIKDGLGDDVVSLTVNAVGVTLATDGGNDTVYGSAYSDTITGSSGNDTIYGYGGNDKLTGSDGNDKLFGGSANNTLIDGAGDDLVDFSQNSVAIVFTTGGGNDTVKGTMFGDKITGTAGADYLYGNGGNDRLFGAAGADHVFGGDGDDWLEAGSAAEVADGGNGTDYNAHLWAIQGANYEDVRQGGAGTCVFLSALAGGADQGIDLASRITYLGNYVYRVKLYNADSELPFNQYVTFDGSFSWINDSHWDPFPATEGEFWTVLYQRAYLKMTNIIDENFKDPDYAMYAVTGREVSTGDWDSPAYLAGLVNNGYVVTAGDADDTPLVYANHSYTMMNVYQSSGTWYIQLRNPWGYDGGSVASGNPDDGLITMTWNAFQGAHDFDRISIS